MAGLGESCSHVASVLWALECGARMRQSMTVTQKKAYWVIPGGIKDVPYAPAQQIKFIGKNKLAASSMLACISSASDISSDTLRHLSPLHHLLHLNHLTEVVSIPTTEEMSTFFRSISSVSSKPAILALVPSYSDAYIPKSLDVDLPLVLTDLYKPDYLKLNYTELLERASDVTLAVSCKEVSIAEQKTRGQAKSRLWFRMRAGRITASRFKSACKTNPSSPSLSLIMSVCHPESTRFRTAATAWGCDHESHARSKYAAFSSSAHQNLDVTGECGLFISSEYPFMAASPDGLISCSCCGDGICEIKVSLNEF